MNTLGDYEDTMYCMECGAPFGVYSNGYSINCIHVMDIVTDRNGLLIDTRLLRIKLMVLRGGYAIASFIDRLLNK